MGEHAGCAARENTGSGVEIFSSAAAEKGQGVCPLRGLGWNPKLPCRNTFQ